MARASHGCPKHQGSTHDNGSPSISSKLENGPEWTDSRGRAAGHRIPHEEDAGHETVLYEVIVPTNALQVEVLFKGSTRTSMTWDSRYGQNYWFPVEA